MLTTAPQARGEAEKLRFVEAIDSNDRHELWAAFGERTRLVDDDGIATMERYPRSKNGHPPQMTTGAESPS